MSVSPLGVPKQESRSQLNRKYPKSIREKAVAMVDRRRLRNPRDRAIFREVAQHFNVGEQSLRLWVRQFDAERLDNGHKSASAKTNGRRVPENVEVELESLRRKIQKLQAENDVLKRAFVVFSTEWSK